MTPEAAVKRRTKEAFDAADAWSYAPVQNGMGVVGIPDRLGCVPYVIRPEDVGRRVGLFVAVECKAPGKRNQTTANQDRQLAGIRAAGGIAAVVDGADQLNEVFP